MMTDRPRAHDPSTFDSAPDDLREDGRRGQPPATTESRFGEASIDHGWWEAIAIAGAKIRDSRSHAELRRRILVQLLSVTGLQRAAWIPAELSEVEHVGAIGEDECRNIAEALRGDSGRHRSSVEWLDHLDANPVFPPRTWPATPASCLLLSLGDGTSGGAPIVYADGAAPSRPSDANLRALEVFAGEARREWVRLAGVSETATYRKQIEAAECEILRRALDHEAWNVSGAARRLDISRQHLHNLLRKHRLKRR